MKLSTRSEIADHFVDDLVAAARQLGSAKAKEAAEILAKWDRQGETTSDGTLLFLRFMQAAGSAFQNIGGYAVAAGPAAAAHDAARLCRSRRGPRHCSRAKRDVSKTEYKTLHVIWGDVIRLRTGSLDLPGNGVPGTLGGIRTIATGPLRRTAKREIQGGDTFYAVIEFQKNGPPIGEALLGYGNWSRAGSKHWRISWRSRRRRQMRPILRARQKIEKKLESRKVF